MEPPVDDDLEVADTEPNDEDAPAAVRYEIASFPTDFTVRVMFEKWRDGQLIIPEFQRRFVWKLPQASRLIDSFLLGLPIPQVFLYRERTSPKLLVIDGQQRLASIAYFYLGRFEGDRVFRLTGVDPRWNGRTYDELSEDDRLTLDDSTLRSIVIQQLQPNDNSSIYQIFERLNTGGTQLNPMEIRKAVFHGPAYEMLDELNKTPNWRALIGLSSEDRRLKDVELVLRILALAERRDSYQKPMKTFITSFMADVAKESDEYREGLKQKFVSASALARELGQRPFHLRGRLNVAALDSVMATLIELGPHGLRPDLQAAYQELLDSPEFQDTAQYDTSDTNVVERRFTVVRARLGS